MTEGADWPTLHPPSQRWTTGWRAGAVVVALATLVIIAGHLVRPGPSPWGWVLVAVGALVVARTSALTWTRAPLPRLRRADVRVLGPRDGTREREKLEQRMRQAVKEREPLTPELRRPAAVAVAVSTRAQPWYPAVVGLFGLAVTVVAGPGSDVSSPFNLVLYVVLAGCYLPIFSEDRRIRHAATAAGALPAVAARLPDRGVRDQPDSGVEMP